MTDTEVRVEVTITCCPIDVAFTQSINDPN